MTIDLTDKYISSLQCIVEMQEEIMNHKRKISQFEQSAKKMQILDTNYRIGFTLDEMIQVDMEPETSDSTLIMLDINERDSMSQDHMDQDSQFENNETQSETKVPDILYDLEKIANDFTEIILTESLKEFTMLF